MIICSNTIELCEGTAVAEQMGQYYENQKLILTDPIATPTAKATFQIDNLKYCVGFGLALKEVIEKHEFNYKCIFLIIQPMQMNFPTGCTSSPVRATPGRTTSKNKTIFCTQVSTN